MRPVECWGGYSTLAWPDQDWSQASSSDVLTLWLPEKAGVRYHVFGEDEPSVSLADVSRDVTTPGFSDGETLRYFDTDVSPWSFGRWRDDWSQCVRVHELTESGERGQQVLRICGADAVRDDEAPIEPNLRVYKQKPSFGGGAFGGSDPGCQDVSEPLTFGSGNLEVHINSDEANNLLAVISVTVSGEVRRQSLPLVQQDALYLTDIGDTPASEVEVSVYFIDEAGNKGDTETATPIDYSGGCSSTPVSLWLLLSLFALLRRRHSALV